MSPHEPLHSPEWYRVAPLRLRLRMGVGVSRQVVRGETWHVLTDPLSGRHHRFNDPAYRFIARCDGSRTLDAAWADALAQDGDAAPTQAEAIRIVAQAHAANLLVGNVAPDAAAIVKAQRRSRRQRTQRQVNPLAFRVRLWNPDAFLTRALPYVRWLLSAPARVAGWVLVAFGALLLALHAGDLAHEAQAHLSAPRLMLIMWLVYPVLKGLHELAHGFVVKRNGGEVVEIGVTLLLLTPVPYVDASAATAFADKRQRVAVAAAGIFVEAIAASLALVAWTLLEPGLAREVCLAVIVVGALSTLLVNGNPLMRFDGYHVLVDQLELPNLAQRSLRWWVVLLQRRVLRLPAARLNGQLPGEGGWLALYAPLSWAWRLALLVGLAVALAELNVNLGLLLLAAALWLCALKPAWAVARWAWGSPEASGQRVRIAATLGTATALAGIALVALPVPLRTHAPAVVWLPDEAILRLHSDARMEAFLVTDGQTVAAGTPIARLSNEELVADLARAQAELTAAEVERQRHFGDNAGRTGMAEDDIRRLRSDVQRLQDQVSHLTLRAGVAGRTALPDPGQVLGRWLSQGETLAHVIPPGAPMVRAMVRNEDVALVRERPGSIDVALSHRDDGPVAGTVTRSTPLATTELPSAALGEAAGGPIHVVHNDTSGRTAEEPRFVFDLRLPEGIDARIGARALVTFTHGHASALQWLGRGWRQAFLRHFER